MTVPLALRRPGLRLSLLASVAGNAAFAVGSWVVMAVLAKIAAPAVVGQYVLALALTAPIFLFSNLQLREVRATEGVDAEPFAAYLKTRLLTSGLAFLVCALAAAFYEGPTRLVVLLTAAARIFDAVVDVLYGEWLRQERQTQVATSMLLRGVTMALFIGLALLVTKSLVVACGVSLFQSALGLMHALWKTPKVGSLFGRREGGTAGKEAKLLPLAACLRLLPLGLAVALDSLTVNVPRYVIQSHLGLAEVGAFGAVCTFMQLGTATVVVGLTQVGLPRLSRLYAAGDRRGYANLTVRLLLAGFGVGLIGLLGSLAFGETMLHLAFGPRYAAYAGVLQTTMFAALAWYASGILACAVTATREFRVQLPVFAAATLVTGAACLFLVPRLGLQGAAISIGLGFFIRALINGALVFRRI